MECLQYNGRIDTIMYECDVFGPVVVSHNRKPQQFNIEKQFRIVSSKYVDDLWPTVNRKLHQLRMHTVPMFVCVLF